MDLQLFLAPNNVKLVDNMEIRPGRVKKQNKALLQEGYFLSPGVPWEQRIDNGYPNVFYDEDAGEYRCYYTCFIQDDAAVERTPGERVHLPYEFYIRERYRERLAGILLAVSPDGENWTRPALNVCDFGGYKDSNIIIARAHGASVFKDFHEKDPAKRYKMVMRHDASGKMAVSFSADGIRWREPIDWPENSPAGDTHNFAFWDEGRGKYVLITRTWEAGGLRLCARCESDDFLHWSAPVEIYRGDGLADQLYSMPVFRRHGLYFGLGSIFHDGDCRAENYDCVDCELLFSYDATHWNRAASGKPFLPRGMGVYGDGVQDSCCIYASAPVERDGRFEIFYMGGNGQHTKFRETALMKATVDPDALAGYAPKDARGGRLSTCQVNIEGDEVFLKAEIGPCGSVSACVSQPIWIHGRVTPLEGYGYEDCAMEAAGENLWRLRFMRPLSELKDRGRVMLVFRVQDAALYGFGGDLKPIRREI